MGKTRGIVVARAKAMPTREPAVNIPVATPAFSRGTQALNSSGKLGYD